MSDVGAALVVMAQSPKRAAIDDPDAPDGRHRRAADVAWYVGALAVVVAAVALRAAGLTWGFPHPMHCDEAKFCAVARRIWEQNTLCPGFYAYGTAVMALVGAAGALVNAGGVFTDALAWIFGARVLAVAADAAVVALVLVLASRLMGRNAAVWAAAAYAFAPLAVREAHYGFVEPWVNAAVVAAMLVCLGAWQRPSPRGFALAGLAGGLAMGVKLSAAPAVALPLVAVAASLSRNSSARPQPRALRQLLAGLAVLAAAVVACFLGWVAARSRVLDFGYAMVVKAAEPWRLAAHGDFFWRRQVASVYNTVLELLFKSAVGLLGLVAVGAWANGRRRTRQWLERLAGARACLAAVIAGAAGGFVLVNPAVILDPVHYFLPAGPGSPLWNYTQARGLADPPVSWTLHFVGTSPVLFPLVHIFPYALGLPLLVMAVFGVVALLPAAVRLGEDRRWIVAVALLFFGAAAAGNFSKMVRYYMVFLPLLAMAFGHLVASAARPRAGRAARGPMAVAAALAIVTAGALSAAYDVGVFLRPDTRLQALSWLDAHARPGEVVVDEKDDAFGITGYNLFRTRRHLTWRLLNPWLYEHDWMGFPLPAAVVEAKRRYLARLLGDADWLILTEVNLVRSRQAARYMPIIARFHEDLIAGRTDFVRAAVFRKCPRLGAATIDDSGAELSWRLFDHPAVFVFRRRSPRR